MCCQHLKYLSRILFCFSENKNLILKFSFHKFYSYQINKMNLNEKTFQFRKKVQFFLVCKFFSHLLNFSIFFFVKPLKEIFPFHYFCFAAICNISHLCCDCKKNSIYSTMEMILFFNVSSFLQIHYKFKKWN